MIIRGMRWLPHGTLGVPGLLALTLAGCTSPPENQAVVMTSSGTPLVCTLTPEQRERDREELLPGLLARAAEVTDLDNGLRLSFTNRPGLVAELAAMMEQERSCCRFLRFQLTAEPAGGAIVLEVTGPPGTREVLRSL